MHLSSARAATVCLSPEGRRRNIAAGDYMVLRGNQGGYQGGNSCHQQNKRDSKNDILRNGYVTLCNGYIVLGEAGSGEFYRERTKLLQTCPLFPASDD